MKTGSLLIVCVVIGGTVGGLVATNPSPTAYERYAVQQADRYLNESLCNELPPPLETLLQGQCGEVVTLARPQIPALVRNRTDRRNWGIFSIYRTTLGLPGLDFLPTYEIKTLAIAGQFVPISAEERP